MRGTIKMTNIDKRFGFIKGDNGVEYFFHESGLKNDSIKGIYKGQPCTFEEDDSHKKGPRAEEVNVE